MWLDVKHIEETQGSVTPNVDFEYTGRDGNSNMPHMCRSYWNNSSYSIYFQSDCLTTLVSEK